jgi:hypothetical protein
MPWRLHHSWKAVQGVEDAGALSLAQAADLERAVEVAASSPEGKVQKGGVLSTLPTVDNTC